MHVSSTALVTRYRPDVLLCLSLSPGFQLLQEGLLRIHLYIQAPSIGPGI